jgi:hypothetical protein
MMWPFEFKCMCRDQLGEQKHSISTCDDWKARRYEMEIWNGFNIELSSWRPYNNMFQPSLGVWMAMPFQKS